MVCLALLSDALMAPFGKFDCDVCHPDWRCHQNLYGLFVVPVCLQSRVTYRNSFVLFVWKKGVHIGHHDG